MDILQQEVRHCRYGEGIIIAQSGQYLSVQFDDEYGTKQFQYPLAFDKYLSFNNPQYQREMESLLHQIHEQEKQERRERKQIREQLEKERLLENIRKTKNKSNKSAGRKT